MKLLHNVHARTRSSTRSWRESRISIVQSEGEPWLLASTLLSSCIFRQALGMDGKALVQAFSFSLSTQRRDKTHHLTLICPSASYWEMTCNLKGKGQWGSFSVSESQFIDTREFFNGESTLLCYTAAFFSHFNQDEEWIVAFTIIVRSWILSSVIWMVTLYKGR